MNYLRKQVLPACAGVILYTVLRVDFDIRFTRMRGGDPEFRYTETFYPCVLPACAGVIPPCVVGIRHGSRFTRMRGGDPVINH